MRFSLKWILAGMVYVAIAAAAFGTGKWYFADLLWALTLLAVVYAIGLGSFAGGKQRATAWMFAVGCICFFGSLVFANDELPTTRLINAVGLDANQRVKTVVKHPIQAGAPMPSIFDSANDVAVTTDSSGQQYLSFTTEKLIDSSVYIRAANAVATLAFGLMGSLVGLMAFRASASRDGAKHE